MSEKVKSNKYEIADPRCVPNVVLVSQNEQYVSYAAPLLRHRHSRHEAKTSCS